jgi:hypothetical protein
MRVVFLSNVNVYWTSYYRKEENGTRKRIEGSKKIGCTSHISLRLYGVRVERFKIRRVEANRPNLADGLCIGENMCTWGLVRFDRQPLDFLSRAIIFETSRSQR